MADSVGSSASSSLSVVAEAGVAAATVTSPTSSSSDAGEGVAGAVAEGSAAAAEGDAARSKEAKGSGGVKVSASQRKAMEAVEKRKAEQVEAEVVRAQSLASLRWSDCLACLQSSLPLLADNPYLCILQPPFLHDYLDSLTETLANLHSHSQELHAVRALLQQVYQSFVDLGKFAKYQPAFYFDDAHSLRRFVRLLEQVSHKSSDKALYPNILSLLTPTLQRPQLYPQLQELGLLRCLIAFAVNGWIPSTHTSLMLFAILEEMTADEAMRRSLQQEQGWERLCKLCWGREAGLSREQQQRGQQALQWAEQDLPDDWKMHSQEHGDEGEEDEDEEDRRSSSAAAEDAQPTLQPATEEEEQEEAQPTAAALPPPAAGEVAVLAVGDVTD